MKLSILKNKAALITAIALLLMTLAGFATALQPIGEDPQYTLEEVVEACEAAYSTNSQITQCVTDVCAQYGCS